MSNLISKKRILIIDDDRPGTEARKLQLELRGFEILLAPSVRDAKEIVAEEIIDLVICDWILPDGRGEEVVRFVNVFCPGIPCIVHSAFESSNGQATGAGASEFVLKGSNPDALINAVDRALALIPQRDATFQDSEKEALGHRLAEILCASLDLPAQCLAPMCLELGNRVDFRSIRPVLSLWAGKGKEHILDCAHYRDTRTGLADWFGEVQRKQQEVVGFRRGALEYTPNDIVIIRHWELATSWLGDQVCATMRAGYLHRLGGKSRIPVTGKILLVLETGAESWTARSEFRELVEPRWYGLRNRMLASHEMWNYTKSLFEIYQNSFSRMSWATRTELKQLPPTITLAEVQMALEIANEARAERIEPEDLELNMLERRVLNPSSGQLSSISEARDAMEAYYVRRVLSQCDGNVAKAAELAKVNRQMIYNYIIKYNIILSEYQA